MEPTNVVYDGDSLAELLRCKRKQAFACMRQMTFFYVGTARPENMRVTDFEVERWLKKKSGHRPVAKDPIQPETEVAERSPDEVPEPLGSRGATPFTRPRTKRRST